MTITKAKIAEHLLEQFGIEYPDSYRFVDAFFQTLINALLAKEDVKLASLGSFHVTHKAERLGRNPKTGEAHPISARQVVSFTPSGKLKVAMNNVLSLQDVEDKEIDKT